MVQPLNEVRQLPQLCILIPAFNEEEIIARTVELWREAADSLAIDYTILVVDDGSTDRTVEILGPLKSGGRLEVVAAAHRGNGPTLCDGYRRAAAIAEYVIQVDADSEIPPAELKCLWQARDSNTVCFGSRQGRQQSAARRFLSCCSRCFIHLLCGSAIKDVNVPFRLIPSPVLRQVIDYVEPSSFAPNVIISGLLSRCGVAVINHPVLLNPITSRQSRFGGFGFAASCLRALAETLWQLRPSQIQKLRLQIAGS